MPVFKPKQSGLRQTWCDPPALLPNHHPPPHCLLPQLLRSYQHNEGSRVPAPRKGDTSGLCFHCCWRSIVFLPATSCPLRLLSPKPFVYPCQNQTGTPPLLRLLTLAEEAQLTFLPSFRFPSLTRQHAGRNPSSRFMEESKTQKHCLRRDLEPRSPDSQAPQTAYLSL